MEKNLGILCHVSSIPSKYGIGDFGQSAKQFIDMLAENGFNIWQILPLNETNKYNCPYASTCYFSYDEMFIDVEMLVSLGLNERELGKLKKLSKTQKVHYDTIKAEKRRLINITYGKLDSRFKNKVKNYAEEKLDIFNYAYYKTLLYKFKTTNWRDVDNKFWNKRNKAYENFKNENIEKIYEYVFGQYLLDGQWKEIRAYARLKGIKILGDLPIYPEPNSFDVFNNPEIFKLSKDDLVPIVYGGVPADHFSEKGQNWETCVYNWEYLKEKNYKYLINKIKNLLEKYDILRLDHFLGYTVHYEINAKDEAKGKWIKAGGNEFFDELAKSIDMSRIVIEDLGVNKLEANRVKSNMNLQGMSVLQMANWDKSSDKYLPQNVTEDSIYYLVTHDSNTFMGYLKEIKNKVKKKLCSVLNIEKKNNKDILIGCIKKMFESKSETIILQIQDILMENKNSRMNTPGLKEHCWEYRVNPKKLKNISKFLNMIK